MKSIIPTITLILISLAGYSQIDLEQILKGTEAPPLIKDVRKFMDKRSPISTTFDDASYEAPVLYNFEPAYQDYYPIHLQPQTSDGGYRLRSGVYSMNLNSFCFRGYTHGPSRGDGHLYAPLKGRKKDLIRKILERYTLSTDVRQRDVQVLIWAIIAGASFDELGSKYQKVLNQLFTPTELISMQTGNFVKDYFLEKLEKLPQISPALQSIINSQKQIRKSVTQNKTYQEIEKIAILSGAAPSKDMVREVSKGRWSYHPNGYFVRFFPNGYPFTRMDVYVPYEGNYKQTRKGKVIQDDMASTQVREVVVNPNGMVATPANRSSQMVGISGKPARDPFFGPKDNEYPPEPTVTQEEEIQEENLSSEEVETEAVSNNEDEYQGQASFKNRQVQIRIWDHQKEDGDIVDIYLNGQLIRQDQEVTKDGYSFDVELTKNENVFKLVAKNEGSITPNTAAISINDGFENYETVLSSKKGESKHLRLKIIE